MLTNVQHMTDDDERRPVYLAYPEHTVQVCTNIRTMNILMTTQAKLTQAYWKGVKQKPRRQHAIFFFFLENFETKLFDMTRK